MTTAFVDYFVSTCTCVATGEWETSAAILTRIRDTAVNHSLACFASVTGLALALEFSAVYVLAFTTIDTRVVHASSTFQL